jgi:hypothetical protein
MWCSVLFKNRNDVRSIHVLMAVVVLLKVFSVLFDGFKFRTLAREGHNGGWAIAFYIFSSLKGRG